MQGIVETSDTTASNLNGTTTHEELEDDRGILILYGSETGTAQDVAERIGRECLGLQLHCRVISMDIYPLVSLSPHSLYHTTGNGTEPRSMSSLWQTLLRSDLPADLLDEIQFAVFGLGDSGYERFNWAAKKLQRRLLVLGGSELVKRGDGDEQDYYGIESALDPWLSKLLPTLKGVVPSSSKPLPTQPYSTTPLSRVRLIPDTEVDTLTEGVKSMGLDTILEVGTSGHISVTLSQNERITRNDWFQDVRHIELETDHDMQSLLENNLHVAAVPRRSFFTWIQHFASDEREIEKLVEFCSKEGQEDLHAYTTRPRRTILEVLSDFKSVMIPLDYIVDVFPPIRPRSFSIASSVKAHPRQIQLCVAIVRYKSLLLKAPRKGLCTAWLSKLKPGTRLRIGLEKGMMRLPEDRSKPVIMIGPGTGVAPLRAMVEERVRDGANDNTLYFGCRSAAADCHYHEDWKALEEKGALRCRIAASRDQDRKIYVQNLLEDDSAIISDLLARKGGFVYICGSSNQMPKAVRRTITESFANQDGWDEERSTKYVQLMEDEGRWSE
ncbi:NAPDH-dependent diflavin reductase, partial [Tulasnella sp. 332]